MPFNRVVELGGFIREQRHKAQLSLRTVASLSGISNPYLSQIERGLRKPSAEILQGIAKALRISSETLYVKAGILDEDPDRSVLAAIEADPNLTDAQKEALARTYESYLGDTPTTPPSNIDPTPEFTH